VTDLTHRVVNRYTKQAGIFEAPPAMMKTIGAWVRQLYAAHVLNIAEDAAETIRYRDKYDKDEPPAKGHIVDITLLQRECKKYTSSSRRYKAKAKKTFPIDLRGWKYLRELKRKHPGKNIAQLQKEEMWDEIEVVLNFRPRVDTKGTWQPVFDRLTVDVEDLTEMYQDGFEVAEFDSVELFRTSLGDLLRILRHELQHVGQTVFKALMDLEEEPGTPSRYLSPDKDDTDKPDRLKESEFYTYLADEIDEFAREYGQKPRRTHFDHWLTRSEFFTLLEDHEPAKFRKAVKEFVKGLAGRGIEIPGVA